MILFQLCSTGLLPSLCLCFPVYRDDKWWDLQLLSASRNWLSKHLHGCYQHGRQLSSASWTLQTGEGAAYLLSSLLSAKQWQIQRVGWARHWGALGYIRIQLFQSWPSPEGTIETLQHHSRENPTAMHWSAGKEGTICHKKAFLAMSLRCVHVDKEQQGSKHRTSHEETEKTAPAPALQILLTEPSEVQSHLWEFFQINVLFPPPVAISPDELTEHVQPLLINWSPWEASSSNVHF